MAITTDTGAKKIENSENWRNIFGIHNDTVDAYDALAEQKDEEIGIVVKGNKTAHTGGAAAGQYIILRNSTITGCDDGLYKAAQAIPYDTAIDSTYLTPVSGGGLNELNASIPALFIDVSNVLLSETSYVDSERTYTAIENGFLFATQSGKPNTTSMTVIINGTNISISDSDKDFGKGSIACGFIKAGDVVKYNNCVIKIFGLRS